MFGNIFIWIGIGVLALAIIFYLNAKYQWFGFGQGANFDPFGWDSSPVGGDDSEV